MHKQWKQLLQHGNIDDETAEQLAEQVRQLELQILAMKAEIKKLPIKEKIARGIEVTLV